MTPTNKKIKIALFALFAVVFLIKAIPAFQMQGPSIAPDEPCVVQRAIYLAENFKLEHCTNILDNLGGDTHPLYVLLIAPIYWFFSGAKAYYAILMLNALLVSTLVFPLFGIFKKFLNDYKIIFLSTIIILFLPQITIFEKSLMTETLFAVVGIWLLHFYLNTFDKSKNKLLNTILTILFIIFAGLTRPFGFMVAFAVMINELIISKDKKYVALIYLPLAAILTAITLLVILPDSIQGVAAKVDGFSKPEVGILDVGMALISQLNSLSVATLIAPLVLFGTYLFKDKSPYLKKIRFFLLSLILINLAISAMHLFGYYIKGRDPGLITRYINLSVIYIFIFTLIFLPKIKQFKFDRINIPFLSVLLFSLIFIRISPIKQSLNKDLISLFDLSRIYGNDLIYIKTHLLIIAGISILSLLASLIAKKKNLFLAIIVIILMTQSIFSTTLVIKESSFPLEIYDYFKDKEVKILFLGHQKEQIPVSHNYWKLISMSTNDITLQFFNGIEPTVKIEVPPANLIELTQYDYIVSRMPLNLPLVTSVEAAIIDPVVLRNEHIFEVK